MQCGLFASHSHNNFTKWPRTNFKIMSKTFNFNLKKNIFRIKVQQYPSGQNLFGPQNQLFRFGFINILIPVYPRRGKIFKTCSNIFMFRYRAFWLFMQIVSNRYFIPYSLIKIQFLQTNNRSDIYLIPKMPRSKYSQKHS